MIPKRYEKFGTVKILTVFRKQWYKNFENPSKFIFIVHPLFKVDWRCQPIKIVDAKQEWQFARRVEAAKSSKVCSYTVISRDRNSFFANIISPGDCFMF